MWAAAINSLKTYFEAENSGVDVRVNASGETPEQPTIRIIRGTQDIGEVAQGRISMDVAIECWAYGVDELAANTDLAALEGAVLRQVRAWGNSNPVAGWQLRVDSANQTIEPDGDVFRPSVGSRMIFKIIGRKLRDSTGNCT